MGRRRQIGVSGKVVGFRLPLPTIVEIDKLSKQENRNRSNMLRVLVYEALLHRRKEKHGR